MTKFIGRTFALILFQATIGCGGEATPEGVRSSSPASSEPGFDGGPTVAATESTLRSLPGQTATADDDPPGLPRRIIYNATISLVVENAASVDEQVKSLVKEAGGYIAETDVTGDSQSRRRATWKVRVPVDRFDGFLAAVSRLGELERTHLDSQDVTQEYYDLDARINNKKEEEKRLLKHLADSTGKLEDILAVEKELSRVRGEIEQMQGRLRYLANLTSLSTITISVVEIMDYSPPVAPTFATQVRRTLDSSLANLTKFGQGIILVMVAVTPWLPLFAILVVLVVGLRRLARGVRVR